MTSRCNWAALRARGLIVLAIPLGAASSCVTPNVETDVELAEQVGPSRRTAFSFAYVSGATSPFSGDVSALDTSSVTNVSQMFREAIPFNRDLDAWDIASLTDATQMLDGSGLSPANYDALLTGWEETQTGVVFGVEGIQYSRA